MSLMTKMIQLKGQDVMKMDNKDQTEKGMVSYWLILHFLFVHIKKITNKLIFAFNINRT